MMSCEYCHAKFDGSLPDAFAQGWGHLRFQINLDGRIINYCPEHANRAYLDMLSLTHHQLINGPTKGGSHAER